LSDFNRLLLLCSCTALGAGAFGVADGHQPVRTLVNLAPMTSDREERRIAEAALIALRSSALDTGEDMARYVMLPDLSPRDADEVIDALAELPKPALCFSFRERGVLLLACWPPDQIHVQGFVEAHNEVANMIVGEMRKRLPENMRILVKDSVSQVRMTPSEFGQWAREYDIVNASWKFVTPEYRLPDGRTERVLHFFRAPTVGPASGGVNRSDGG
jgi:hypothetical protein